jgi:predicted nucleotide-binding protein
MRERNLADPKVMLQEFGAGRTLPEKFEELAQSVDAAIALATPDDLGSTVSDPSDQMACARQNVWLEVGWFWGRLRRDRVMVLVKGELEIPSDVLGIEYYRYTSDPREQAESIRAFLNHIGRRA